MERKKQKENRYEEKKIVSFSVCLIARSGVMCYPIKQNVFIAFMEYKNRSLIIRMSKVLFDSIRQFDPLSNSVRYYSIVILRNLSKNSINYQFHSPRCPSINTTCCLKTTMPNTKNLLFSYFDRQLSLSVNDIP